MHGERAMEQRTYATILGPGLKKLIWLGAAAAWAALGLYFYKFAIATGRWFELSSDKQDWGTFGDYLGGVLNPFFSYLAFLGVLFTVILQARQLDTMRQQAGHEEMQRVQASVSQRIDAMLDQPFAPKVQVVSDSPVPPTTVRDAIEQLGMFVIRPRPRDDATRSEQDKQIGTRIFELAPMAFPISRELNSLGWLMERYKQAGGHVSVMDHYSFRYVYWATLLAGLRFAELHAYPNLHAFFEPSKHRDRLAGVTMPSEQPSAT